MVCNILNLLYKLLSITIVTLIIINQQQPSPTILFQLQQTLYQQITITCNDHNYTLYHNHSLQHNYTCIDPTLLLSSSTYSVTMNTSNHQLQYMLTIMQLCSMNYTLTLLTHNHISQMILSSLMLSNLQCRVNMNDYGNYDTILLQCSQLTQCQQLMDNSKQYRRVIIKYHNIHELDQYIQQQHKIVDTYLIIQNKVGEVVCVKDVDVQQLLMKAQNRGIIRKPITIKNKQYTNVNISSTMVQLEDYKIEESRYTNTNIMYIYKQQNAYNIDQLLLYLHQQYTTQPYNTHHKYYIHMHHHYTLYQCQLLLILYTQFINTQQQVYLLTQQHKYIKLMHKNMVINDVDYLIYQQEVHQQPLRQIINSIIQNEREVRKLGKPNNKHLFITYSDIKEESKAKELKYLMGDIVQNKGNITILILINQQHSCKYLQNLTKIIGYDSIANAQVQWFIIPDQPTANKIYIKVPLTQIINNNQCDSIRRSSFIILTAKFTKNKVRNNIQQTKQQLQQKKESMNKYRSKNTGMVRQALDVPQFKVRHQLNVPMSPVQKYMHKFTIDDNQMGYCRWYRNQPQQHNQQSSYSESICNVDRVCTQYGQTTIIQTKYYGNVLNVVVPQCGWYNRVQYEMGVWSMQNMSADNSNNILYELDYYILPIMIAKIRIQNTLNIHHTHYIHHKNLIMNDVTLNTNIIQKVSYDAYDIMFIKYQTFTNVYTLLKPDTILILQHTQHIQSSNNYDVQQGSQHCKDTNKWYIVKIK